MASITFVDENDVVIGVGPKQEAWQKGIWHRVSRIFLFNSKGELLIQKRAMNRASLPGRWDQSAAGHVDEGETYLEAAEREMREEVHVDNILLTEVGKFKTDEKDEADKAKKKFCMLYVGHYNGIVAPNVNEVSEVRWVNLEDLKEWMRQRPDEFTECFILSFNELLRKGIPNYNVV